VVPDLHLGDLKPSLLETTLCGKVPPLRDGRDPSAPARRGPAERSRHQARPGLRIRIVSQGEEDDLGATRRWASQSDVTLRCAHLANDENRLGEVAPNTFQDPVRVEPLTISARELQVEVVPRVEVGAARNVLDPRQILWSDLPNVSRMSTKLKPAASARRTLSG
jgi:hypothetical protein